MRTEMIATQAQILGSNVTHLFRNTYKTRGYGG